MQRIRKKIENRNFIMIAMVGANNMGFKTWVCINIKKKAHPNNYTHFN